MKERALICFGISLAILGSSSFGNPQLVLAKQNSQQFYAQASSRKQLPTVLRSVLPQIKRKTKVPIFLPSQLPSTLTNGQRIYASSSAKSTGYRISIGTVPNCNAEACYVGFIIAERGNAEYFDAEKTKLVRNIIGYYTPRSYKQPPSIGWVYQGISYSISLKEYLYTTEENPNPNKIKAWLIRVANSAIEAGLR